jgi:type VI secretion system protein VasD
MNIARIAAALLLAAPLLTGCAAPPPPPPPPTVVNISVKAGPDMNPDPTGQGAPMVLRVYQLTSGAGFSNAEFFALYKADAATLGPDIVHRDDLALNPGDTKTLPVSPTDQVKTIGFFAGVRDFSQGPWRATADIPPHQTTNITVTATKAGIDVVAKTLPPPPPKPAS